MGGMLLVISAYIFHDRLSDLRVMTADASADPTAHAIPATVDILHHPSTEPGALQVFQSVHRRARVNSSVFEVQTFGFRLPSEFCYHFGTLFPAMDRVIRLQTSRGRDAISYNDYSYRFDRRAANGDIQWRCLRDNCYGRLRTDVDYNQPIIFGNPHAHPSNAEDGTIRATLSRMRERAATENMSIPQIYQQEANRLSGSASASAMLPTLQSIDTSLYRARRRRLPPLPLTRPEIIIPERLQFTPTGENFVLLQLQNNDHIVFGTISDFDALCEKSHVYMDGTFDTCPRLFRQLFTLHAFFGERQVPLLYVLMSSKERGAYVSLFRGLKDIAATRGRRFSPQFILSDFESGLIPAIQEEFPQAHHQGCYFHFMQAIWRKVQDLGLVQNYTHNAFVKDGVRRLMALGFLVVEDVPIGLELIRLSLPGPERNILINLFDYFEVQWFHRIPISMWNVHGMQRRTNNNCEGWHNKFNRFVNRFHPNLWHLISHLQSEQAASIVERHQISSGQHVQRRIVRYTRINQALDVVTARYTRGELEIVEFLTAVGYNLARMT